MSCNTFMKWQNENHAMQYVHVKIYIHYTFHTQKKPRYPPWKKLINQTAWRGRLTSLRVTSKNLLVNASPTLISKNMYFLPACFKFFQKKASLPMCAIFFCFRALTGGRKGAKAEKNCTHTLEGRLFFERI